MRNKIAKQLYLCAAFHHKMPRCEKWESLQESTKDVWRGYADQILAIEVPGWVVTTNLKEVHGCEPCNLKDRVDINCDMGCGFITNRPASQQEVLTNQATYTGNVL